MTFRSRSFSVVAGVAVFVAFAVSSCSYKSNPVSALTPALAAPSNLTYSMNPASYMAGTGIAANSPTSSGGAIALYSVDPALPAGLTMNTTTGVITGTPTIVTTTATYTVTATNAAGSTTVSLSITINMAPPANLTYSTNPVSYVTGTAIAANSPTSSGGAVASYSADPTLPAGLTINTATGVITGTPTTATATANYTVTATNASGSATVPLSITITPEIVGTWNLTTVTIGTYTIMAGTATMTNVETYNSNYTYRSITVDYMSTPAMNDTANGTWITSGNKLIVTATGTTTPDTATYTISGNTLSMATTDSTYGTMTMVFARQ